MALTYEMGYRDGFKAGIKEVVEEIHFMWGMIKHCPNCGSYIPQNLNGTRTHTCQNCGWSGEKLKTDWQAFKKSKGIE